MACVLCADLRGQTPPPQLSKFTLKTKIGFVHPGKQKFSSDPIEVFFGIRVCMLCTLYACGYNKTRTHGVARLKQENLHSFPKSNTKNLPFTKRLFTPVYIKLTSYLLHNYSVFFFRCITENCIAYCKQILQQTKISHMIKCS